MDTKDFGTISMQGIVPKLSATPGEICWPGPELGEHNEQIYGGLLGLSNTEIANLRAEGVI